MKRPATHELKTDPDTFDAVWRGAKTHEIRLNDRDFMVGDILLLKETVYSGRSMRWGSPLAFTGRELTRTVSHILTGYGLMPGWFILSLTPPQAEEVTRLRELAAVAYAGLGAECNLPDPWLDAFSEASEGRPFSTEGLLPFTRTPE